MLRVRCHVQGARGVSLCGRAALEVWLWSARLQLAQGRHMHGGCHEWRTHGADGGPAAGRAGQGRGQQRRGTPVDENLHVRTAEERLEVKHEDTFDDDHLQSSRGGGRGEADPSFRSAGVCRRGLDPQCTVHFIRSRHGGGGPSDRDIRICKVHHQASAFVLAEAAKHWVRACLC